MSTQSGETKLTLTNKIGWAFALSLLGVILLGSVIGPMVPPLPNPAAKSSSSPAVTSSTIDQNEPVSNPQHRALLAEAVAAAGHPCELTSATRKGQYKGSVIYIVGCKSGDDYIVKVDAPDGETTVTNCDMARLIGVDCRP